MNYSKELLDRMKAWENTVKRYESGLNLVDKNKKVIPVEKTCEIFENEMRTIGRMMNG